jgi:hypothetical protein
MRLGLVQVACFTDLYRCSSLYNVWPHRPEISVHLQLLGPRRCVLRCFEEFATVCTINPVIAV